MAVALPKSKEKNPSKEPCKITREGFSSFKTVGGGRRGKTKRTTKTNKKKRPRRLYARIQATQVFAKT